MKKQHILLVEDDLNLGSILSEYLKVKGFAVELSRDGESALIAFAEGQWDLCILDVMLPKKDGFSLAEDIRKTDQQVPIIFLTARDMIEDKTKGFTLGGDDYLTKPFSMEELLLRIGALLRRQGRIKEGNSGSEQFKLGKFSFDYPSRNLSGGKEPKRLTSREAELLKLLCQHKNELLRREVALKTIWGDDSYFNARSMDVFITKLRKYLKEDPRLEIMNVHGAGYRLNVAE